MSTNTVCVLAICVLICFSCVRLSANPFILQQTPASCVGKDKINCNFQMILKSFRQTLSKHALLLQLFFTCIGLLKPLKGAITFRYVRYSSARLPCCSPASTTRTTRRHFSSSPRDRRTHLNLCHACYFLPFFHH